MPLLGGKGSKRKRNFVGNLLRLKKRRLYEIEPGDMNMPEKDTSFSFTHDVTCSMIQEVPSSGAVHEMEGERKMAPTIPRSNSSASTNRGSVFSDPNTCPTYCTSPVPSPVFAMLERKASNSSQRSASTVSRTSSSYSAPKCPLRNLHSPIQPRQADATSTNDHPPRKFPTSFPEIPDRKSKAENSIVDSIRKSADWIAKLNSGSGDQDGRRYSFDQPASSAVLESSASQVSTKAERRKVTVTALHHATQNPLFIETQFQKLALDAENTCPALTHCAVSNRNSLPVSDVSTYLSGSVSDITISDISADREAPATGTSGRLKIDNVLSGALKNIKQNVVQHVMEELRMLFDVGAATRDHTNGETASSRESVPIDAGGSSRPPSWDNSNKRCLEGSGPNGQGDGNDPDEERGKRPKKTHDAESETFIRPRFACPFYKRSPGSNKRWPSCAGPGWNSVHRVKEHVYRRHARAILCSRCYQEFESEEALAMHSRSESPCPIVEVEPPELDGYTKDQEKRMRSRKRPPGVTEQDRWVEMYQVLFSSDPESSIPSPYYEAETTEEKHLSTGSEEFARYQEYSRTELPRLVQQNILAWVQQRSATLEEDLKSGLPDLVRNCQEVLFESFRQNSAVPSSTFHGELGADLKPDRLEFVKPPPPVPDEQVPDTYYQLGRSMNIPGARTSANDSGYSSMEYSKANQDPADSACDNSVTSAERTYPSQDLVDEELNGMSWPPQYQTVDSPLFQHTTLSSGGDLSRFTDLQGQFVDQAFNLSEDSEHIQLYGSLNDMSFDYLEDLSRHDSHATQSLSAYATTIDESTRPFDLYRHHS